MVEDKGSGVEVFCSVFNSTQLVSRLVANRLAVTSPSQAGDGRYKPGGDLDSPFCVASGAIHSYVQLFPNKSYSLFSCSCCYFVHLFFFSYFCCYLHGNSVDMKIVLRISIMVFFLFSSVLHSVISRCLI